MTFMTRLTAIIAAIAALALLGIVVAVVMPPGGSTAGPLPLDTITLPPGFEIDVYAGNVTGRGR